MSYPYFTRNTHVLGPAIARYYDRLLTISDPVMRCEPGLRYKLSKAVSHLFFLQPHSIILTQVEAQPLSAYHNPDAYSLAKLLYFGGSDPGKDLHNCILSVQGIFNKF